MGEDGGRVEAVDGGWRGARYGRVDRTVVDGGCG